MRTGEAQFLSFNFEDECWDDYGLAVMSNLQEGVEPITRHDSAFLYLSAVPFHEAVNGYGPFVMNSYAKILEAFDAIKTGNFIRYPAQELGMESTHTSTQDERGS
jgi:hypothetical protein